MTPPLPPRSPGLPLVGETLAFLRDRAGFVAQRRARYGPLFRTRLFGVEVYVAAAPEVSAALLRGEHRSFEATWPTSTRRLLGPATLATQEGELHRRRRRMLAQAFGPRALAGYAPRIDAMIAEYLARWREGRPIVWADELRAMTFDVATTLFTGARAGAGSGLMRDFEAYAAGLFMPALAIPGTPFFAALRARRRLLGHIEGVVAERRGAPRAAGDPDVLDLLLDARDEDGAGLDEREIGEQILLLLPRSTPTPSASTRSASLRRVSPAPGARCRRRAWTGATSPSAAGRGCASGWSSRASRCGSSRRACCGSASGGSFRGRTSACACSRCRSRAAASAWWCPRAAEALATSRRRARPGFFGPACSRIDRSRRRR